MKPHEAIHVLIGSADPVRRSRGPEPQRRLHWGLSARLPRWRAFDGRRSRVMTDVIRRGADADV